MARCLEADANSTCFHGDEDDLARGLCIVEVGQGLRLRPRILLSSVEDGVLDQVLKPSVGLEALFGPSQISHEVRGYHQLLLHFDAHEVDYPEHLQHFGVGLERNREG